MGQLLEHLTNSNTALATPGGPTFVGSPQQVLSKANAGLPSAESMLGPDAVNPQVSTPSGLPLIGKPTPQQALSAGAQPGGVNALSPGLSKGGKLLTLLTSGLQGALAGHAAQEQAIIQSGGHRSGGAGLGFEAGVSYPQQRAQQQAETTVAQAGAQPFEAQGENGQLEKPFGNLPAALSQKFISPYLGYQGKIGAANIGAQARENVANTGAQARIQGAQIGAGARTGSAQIGADARVKAAQLNLGPLAAVPQDLQDQFGLPPQLPLRMLNQAETAANKPLTIVQGEAGPAIVNKAQAAKGKGPISSLGLGAPANARPVQAAADPTQPGNLTYMRAGQAERTGALAPGSAPTTTAKATAKAMAPGGKVGEEANALGTAIRHADLLTQAAEALHNGNQQTLNGLKNKFKNEFGSTEPITANTIAAAYTREITKMLSGGHMTDSEIGQVGSTLDPNRQSLPQMQSVIGAYKALASSKMQVRKQGVEQGLKGKANFPSEGGQEIHYKIVDGQLVRQ